MLIDTGIIGGPGRGIIQLATFLASRGLEYAICTIEYRKPMRREFVHELAERGLRAATITQRVPWDPSPLWQFARLVKRGRYNIIQSHGYKSHFIACMVSRALGIPWVAFAHGWTQEDRKVALYHSLDTWMLRCAELVVAVSPALRAFLSSLRGDRPTELVLNAVNPDALTGDAGGAIIRDRCTKGDVQFLIGCFGRLSFEKGQDVLLRSVKRVVQSIPAVTVLLLGDGPDLASLQKLSDELGIRDRVIFQPHSCGMRDYYEAIDLLVLPSRSEGLPNVVLEALCCGVPVIATNVGAVCEVITRGETGWVVPVEDVEALGDAIVEALSDQNARDKMSRTGKLVMAEKFSPITRGEKILDLYRTLLKSE